MNKLSFISIVTATTLISSSAFAYTHSFKQGWNLLGATEDITNFDNFKQNGSIMWVYDGGDWQKVDLDSNSKIEKGRGFWFKSNNAVIGEESTTTEKTTTTENSTNELTFRVVDTNQNSCFNTSGSEVSCSGSGQDGAYIKNAPSYTNNGDGTVTDNISGIIWQQTSDTNGDGVINVSDKMSQSDAESYCSSLSLAGQSDWRLPDIKTMYSLIDFSGQDVSGYESTDTSGLNPFINDDVFGYGYGDTSAGERIIDAQWATTTIYVSTTMNGDETMFGVNLADGRIKGYPIKMMNQDKLFYVQCVRGNEAYGQNNFVDNGDSTITDKATGLIWQQNDSEETMGWDEAINYCENLTLAGYDNWRLPNAKELESIVDYTKSPDTTNSPAIDTNFFNSTSITNEEGESDYGFYWSSTTHNKYNNVGDSAVYVSFGRALGYMNNSWLDVHGAGAQRSDPKVMDSTLNQQGYQNVSTYNGGTAVSHGPQGDVVRGDNFVRCVRDMD